MRNKRAIALATLKVTNQTVIKSIPTVGPFASAIIAGQMDSEGADLWKNCIPCSE